MTKELKEPEQLERESGSSRRLYHGVKRGMDLVLALLALVGLSPVLLLLCLLIRLDSKGPAIYIHHRVGKHGRPLPLLKFRTMYMNADELFDLFTPEQKEEWARNFKLEHDPRITRIGKILRKTSLDELPQLVNIIKGELSIVGPRPVVPAELEKYGSNKDKFLSVTPGLTGYWQAYARSNCSYEQRIQMELYYVEHANFWWDLRIIFATVGVVLKGKGAW